MGHCMQHTWLSWLATLRTRRNWFSSFSCSSQHNFEWVTPLTHTCLVVTCTVDHIVAFVWKGRTIEISSQGKEEIPTALPAACEPSLKFGFKLYFLYLNIDFVCKSLSSWWYKDIFSKQINSRCFSWGCEFECLIKCQ